MKQNNLLRVYMKLEQHSYSGQDGIWEHGGGGGGGIGGGWR